MRFFCGARVNTADTLKRADRPRGGEIPPLGGASIAPGYTPGAFAGAKPRHPLPPEEVIGTRGER